eukprot:7152040-Pyramimonas_sp.AAC.2
MVPQTPCEDIAHIFVSEPRPCLRNPAHQDILPYGKAIQAGRTPFGVAARLQIMRPHGEAAPAAELHLDPPFAVQLLELLRCCGDSHAPNCTIEVRALAKAVQRHHTAWRILQGFQAHHLGRTAQRVLRHRSGLPASAICRNTNQVAAQDLTEDVNS